MNLLLRDRPKNPESTILFVPVQVLEEKTIFGEQRCLVEPRGGYGSRWVARHNLVDHADAKDESGGG